MPVLRVVTRPRGSLTADPVTFDLDLADHDGDWDVALEAAHQLLPPTWVLADTERHE